MYDDEAVGRHSRIPPCCREWFIRVWSNVFLEIRRGPIDLRSNNYAIIRATMNSFYMDSAEELGYATISYVRCPSCRATGAYIHLLHCKRSCKICFGR